MRDRTIVKIGRPKQTNQLLILDLKLQYIYIETFFLLFNFEATILFFRIFENVSTLLFSFVVSLQSEISCFLLKSFII